MSIESPLFTEPEMNSGCDPDEVALKSFFLGPQSENAQWLGEMVSRVVDAYVGWRRRIHPEDGDAISEIDQGTPEFKSRQAEFGARLDELLARFEQEVPKFSPRYIGHMFSETSMPAMVGHLVTLLHNPNNISGESSRVGVQLEEEAVTALADMLGFSKHQGVGHFTSGGTVANFEAMVRARHRMERFIALGARTRQKGLSRPSLFEAAHIGWKLYGHYLRVIGIDDELEEALEPLEGNPFDVARRLGDIFDEPYRGPVVLVPDHKHYSWVKGVGLMGLGYESFWSVALDDAGVMSVPHLEERIEEARRMGRPIMMVVSVAGTTELGAFDPVHKIQDLLDRYASEQGIHIYHHVDAAYGGFFAANVCGGQCCVMGPDVCAALRSIRRANSVTLDPHKLGYVPYSSGTFLARSRREYFSNKVDAPYLDFKEGVDRGPQTIEGSRSAAGAVATWLTAGTIGLDADGYGRILRRTIQARIGVQQALEELDIPVRIIEATSNILAFCVAYDGEAVSVTNERTQKIYDAFSPEKDGEFYVSRTTLHFGQYGEMLTPFIGQWSGEADEERLIMIRLTMMNPFLDSRETRIDYARAFSQAVAQVIS